MHSNPRVRRRGRAVALVAGLTLAVAASLPAGADDGTVVDGLAGPLGLAIGDDGTIYVAEAFAGVLTSVDARGQRRVLHEGAVNGVDATGRGNVAVVGAGESGTTLDRVLPNGRSTTLASLQDHEERVNPDADARYGVVDADASCLAELEAIDPFLLPYDGIVESNPYAVAIAGGRHLVADAAGNSIVAVGRNGRLSTVAVLPPVAMTITQEVADALSDMLSEQVGTDIQLPACIVGLEYHAEPVPTDVEVGPDGHLYVSSLPGFPELPGTGSVWRVHSRTGALTQVATGLTGAVDVAVAADGTIYVAELFASQVSRIQGGTVSVFAELPTPGAVEVGPDGSVYVTTGVFGPSGSVVRLAP